jgi:hypothetical protein
MFLGTLNGGSLHHSWEVEIAHALHDPVRHNAWATTQILHFCRGLDEHTLNATVALAGQRRDHESREYRSRC